MKFYTLFLATISLAACTTTQGHSESVSKQEVHAMVDEAATTHGVPRNIAHGVVRTESNYRCNARNPRSGATGILQVMPRTARGMGIHGNLANCKVGLEAGMRYLRMALDRGGETCEGISLYERGINAPLTCTSYGRKVLNHSS